MPLESRRRAWRNRDPGRSRKQATSNQSRPRNAWAEAWRIWSRRSLLEALAAVVILRHVELVEDFRWLRFKRPEEHEHRLLRFPRTTRHRPVDVGNHADRKRDQQEQYQCGAPASRAIDGVTYHPRGHA